MPSEQLTQLPYILVGAGALLIILSVIGFIWTARVSAKVRTSSSALAQPVYSGTPETIVPPILVQSALPGDSHSETAAATANEKTVAGAPDDAASVVPLPAASSERVPPSPRPAFTTDLALTVSAKAPDAPALTQFLEGTSIAPQPPANVAFFCTNCGAPLPASAKFCHACGERRQ